MLASMIYQPLMISGLIEHAARFHGETEIVSINTEGGVERLNWRIAAQHARQLADALSGMGLGQGTRCATLAWNNRRHVEIYFGVAGGGFVCHTINPRLSAEDLIYVINDAEDRILFIDRSFLAMVAALRPQLKTVERIVLLGEVDAQARAEIEDLISYDELIAAADPDYCWPVFDETTASSLCYTSGTTGKPKGVLYTHRSTVLHAFAASGADAMAIAARDSVMPVVPMFHVNAWSVPYIAAMQGARLVLPGPRLDGESLARLIEAETVTFALGVPTIWLGLLEALRRGLGSAASMRRCLVGGAAMAPAMIAAFREEFGIELIHAWGMTETSPLGVINQLKPMHMQLPEAERHALRAAQGRPPYGVDIRLVDENQQQIGHDGITTGRLQIRGHWVVDCYSGDSRSALTGDGWFDTGDVATIDADGFMTIRDRSKDLIKSGGEWISSVEIENIAISHPSIARAAAIAARHAKWGERPVLIAVRAEGEMIEAEALRGFFRGKLPDWQHPDAVIFVEQLPLGGTGKVLKTQLRALYGEVLVAGSAAGRASRDGMT